MATFVAVVAGGPMLFAAFGLPGIWFFGGIVALLALVRFVVVPLIVIDTERKSRDG